MDAIAINEAALAACKTMHTLSGSNRIALANDMGYALRSILDADTAIITFAITSLYEDSEVFGGFHEARQRYIRLVATAKRKLKDIEDRQRDAHKYEQYAREAKSAGFASAFLWR